MKKIMIISASVLAFIAVTVFFLFAAGVIVTDHSAQTGFENSV